MAHVYSLGHLLGVSGSRAVASRALAALRTSLHDQEYGGWYASLAPDGTPDTTKSAYAHAFVVLAASTGTLAPAARALYDGAVRDGWSVDGAPGFVCTTDWAGAPVVHTRMHCVVAEAIGAAAALHQGSGEGRYAQHYARWWDYAAECLIDRERGSWHHEPDPSNVPGSEVWPGKPDVYHAFQATLLPLLPLAPGLAIAVRDGLAAPC